MAFMTKEDTVCVQFAGRSFFLDTAGGMDRVAATIAAGNYEVPLPIMLAAMVSRVPGMFLDVGANDGVYSVIAAAIKPDLRIAAFEPVPQIANLLRRNIELNDIAGRVDIYELALSDSEGIVPIFLPDPAHGLIETSASLEENFIVGATPAMSVRTTKLDNLTLPAAIGVAKVDIEGFELEFIRGAEETIRRDRPVIFAEMLSRVERKFPEITQRMIDMDYLMFRLRPDAAILSHWISFDQQSWNYCLLPREKMNVFRECCVTHQLEILAPA
ncbi:FkbM family methyltransferase [Sphingobium sp. Z007]|uniref:FkbM family methyltransferase n=1 Tax=Sphingobium sp. Z007 TaxID=627495 RepID=UPI000B4A09FF|nr:FkbM family methyltransferase [Sphingobium sp. Z007]